MKGEDGKYFIPEEWWDSGSRAQPDIPALLRPKVMDPTGVLVGPSPYQPSLGFSP
jgi:hypothetical protein